MIAKTVNNRMVVVSVELAECPWLRDTNVQLPGYIHQNYASTIGNIRTTKLHHGILLRCYESTSGNYVVNLHYGNSASDEDKAKTITALNKWIDNLATARSCAVDPTTGKPPCETTQSIW